MLNLFVTTNLVDPDVKEGNPWEWEPTEAHASHVRSLGKKIRNGVMRQKKTEWNIYSVFRGHVAGQVVSNTNPAYGCRGFAADFDARFSFEMFQERLKEMPVELHPTFFEQSLSGNVRLVWVFEEEKCFHSTAFAKAFLRELGNRLMLEKWLPGLDDKTFDPAMRWTNGIDWYEVTGKPLSPRLIDGVYMEAAKHKETFGPLTIPYEHIKEEIEKRWPNRWQGDFIEGATGVRFWDPEADNECGCQVKPDGMLCFTGVAKHGPFLKWEQIFDREFIQSHTKDRLAAAGEGIYYDSKDFWQHTEFGGWQTLSKETLQDELVAAGVNPRTQKGQLESEVKQVMTYIRRTGRIAGAGPFINFPPGLVNRQDGTRFLNTTRLIYPEAVKGITGTPEDFPFTWELLSIIDGGLDNLLGWMRRFYVGLTTYEQVQGQAVFICGEAECGKSLLINHIFVPLFGGAWSNPYDYLNGNGTFSDFVFDAPLLVLDDQVSPPNAYAKHAFTARLKHIIAQPGQVYHAKFSRRVQIIWVGRLVGSMNDDPESLGMLPSTGDGMHDKMMFFRAVRRRKMWPTNKECEAMLTAERGAFIWWLLNSFDVSKVARRTRMGIECYYDPKIVRFSEKQHVSASMDEILALFAEEMLANPEKDRPATVVKLTPTQLLHQLDSIDGYSHVLREWTSDRTYKALQHLAKENNSGIKQLDSGTRTFSINLETLAAKRHMASPNE